MSSIDHLTEAHQFGTDCYVQFGPMKSRPALESDPEAKVQRIKFRDPRNKTAQWEVDTHFLPPECVLELASSTAPESRPTPDWAALNKSMDCYHACQNGDWPFDPLLTSRDNSVQQSVRQCVLPVVPSEGCTTRCSVKVECRVASKLVPRDVG